jgi:hypothetical protein
VNSSSLTCPWSLGFYGQTRQATPFSPPFSPPFSTPCHARSHAETQRHTRTLTHTHSHYHSLSLSLSPLHTSQLLPIDHSYMRAPISSNNISFSWIYREGSKKGIIQSTDSYFFNRQINSRGFASGVILPPLHQLSQG